MIFIAILQTNFNKKVGLKLVNLFRFLSLNKKLILLILSDLQRLKTLTISKITDNKSSSMDAKCALKKSIEMSSIPSSLCLNKSLIPSRILNIVGGFVNLTFYSMVA